MLRSAPQHREGLVAGDVFAFDEDALGLSDELPCPQGFVQVGDSGLVLGSFAGGVEGEAGEGGEDHALRAVRGSEGGW